MLRSAPADPREPAEPDARGEARGAGARRVPSRVSRVRHAVQHVELVQVPPSRGACACSTLDALLLVSPLLLSDTDPVFITPVPIPSNRLVYPSPAPTLTLQVHLSLLNTGSHWLGRCWARELSNAFLSVPLRFSCTRLLSDRIERANATQRHATFALCNIRFASVFFELLIRSDLRLRYEATPTAKILSSTFRLWLSGETRRDETRTRYAKQTGLPLGYCSAREPPVVFSTSRAHKLETQLLTPSSCTITRAMVFALAHTRTSTRASSDATRRVGESSEWFDRQQQTGWAPNSPHSIQLHSDGNSRPAAQSSAGGSITIQVLFDHFGTRYVSPGPGPGLGR